MMAAAISTTKNVHSMAQPQTKLWMSASVADGFNSPIMNQIPTPLSAPNTSVTSTKNLLSFWRNSNVAVSPAFTARRSVTTRNNPPPMAKCETKTCSTAMTAIKIP